MSASIYIDAWETQSTVRDRTIPAHVNIQILSAEQEKQTLISHCINLVHSFPG